MQKFPAEMFLLGKQTSVIRVHWLPFRVDNDEVYQWVQEFRDGVLNIYEQSIARKTQGLLTGIRWVKCILWNGVARTDVPYNTTIFVEDGSCYSAIISVEGRMQKCLKCEKLGHIRREDKAKKFFSCMHMMGELVTALQEPLLIHSTSGTKKSTAMCCSSSSRLEGLSPNNPSSGPGITRFQPMGQHGLNVKRINGRQISRSHFSRCWVRMPKGELVNSIIPTVDIPKKIWCLFMENHRHPRSLRPPQSHCKLPLMSSYPMWWGSPWSWLFLSLECPRPMEVTWPGRLPGKTYQPSLQQQLYFVGEWNQERSAWPNCSEASRVSCLVANWQRGLIGTRSHVFNCFFIRYFCDCLDVDDQAHLAHHLRTFDSRFVLEDCLYVILVI